VQQTFSRNKNVYIKYIINVVEVGEASAETWDDDLATINYS